MDRFTPTAWIRTALPHAPIAALAISVALNIVFSMKLVAEEERRKPGLRPGQQLSAIAAGPRGQAAVQFAKDERPVIFYHFSATCGWCERNWSNVSALARRTGNRFRFVGLSLEKLPDGFLNARGVEFPVFDGLAPETAKAFKLGATPQTILVSGGGEVLESWFGSYSGGQARAIEEYFDLKLPGLDSLKKARARAGE